MKVVLVIIAAVSVVYGLLALPEMLLVSIDSEATVLQQISARLGIGLSLLIFVCSAGFAAMLGALDQRGREASASADRTISAIGRAAEPADEPKAQPNKAELRRQRLAERMGVTLPTEEEEKAALAREDADAGGIALKSGFVIREKAVSKESLDHAVEQHYKKHEGQG